MQPIGSTLVPALILTALGACSAPDDARVPAGAAAGMVAAESTVTPVEGVDVVHTSPAGAVPAPDPLHAEARQVAEKVVQWLMPVCGDHRFDESRTGGLGHVTVREITDLLWRMEPDSLTTVDPLNAVEYRFTIVYRYPASRDVDLLAARADDWEESVGGTRNVHVRRREGVWQIESAYDGWTAFDTTAAPRSPTFRYSCERVATIMAGLQ